VKKRTLLLDADIIAFRLAARNETDTAFGKAVDPLGPALRETDAYIAELKKDLKATDVIVCLTCREHNFRYDVRSDYKGKRKTDGRPEHLTAIKNHMEEEYETFIRYSLEADDVMGILQTHPTLVAGETVIVSEDKDMRTVPGLLYAPHRPELGVIDVTPLEAAQFHMWQTICGDTVDDYTGARGVGKASLFAQAVLEEDGPDLWDTVCHAFGYVGATEAHALQQARLAKILTRECYDFTTKEVILWEPESLTLLK